MARHFQGPNQVASYRTSTNMVYERPYVHVGTIVPAASPGTTLTNPVNGPCVIYGQVASADANAWINLPEPIVGTEIVLLGGSTGYELRTSSPTTVFINASSAGANAESAIAASLTIWCRCITPTYWLVTNFALDGTEAAEEAAA
jgi:hypothetical protein